MLALEVRLISMLFVQARWVFTVPLEEALEVFRPIFAPVVSDLAGIAQQEVKDGASGGAFATGWLKVSVSLIHLATAAVVGFTRLLIQAVVTALVIAVSFRCEKVVKVPSHGLTVVEPSPGDHMLAVKVFLGLQGCAMRRAIAKASVGPLARALAQSLASL